MPSEKFLKQVADYYLNKDIDMTHTTFVFPNKRSAAFMHKYMKQQAVIPLFKPQMVSVTYFTQQLSKRTSVSNTELIFILYKAYCKVLMAHNKEDQISDFDSFYFWGSIILNDFNDVDAYLVNPKELYNNLKGVREIKANYLTPEQVEVIRYIWGDDFSLPDEDIFWQHTRDALAKGSGSSSKFLNLWEIMGELYETFTEALSKHNPPIAYAGLQSRIAYENIKGQPVEYFKGRHYVFVGFNILSAARTLIFKRLQDLGVAEFFWDTASPLITSERAVHSSNGQFILPLARIFKMPDDFELQPLTPCQDIEIISVPSAVGQTKVASEILNGWVKDWALSGDDALSADALVDTAVVLADESLLMPMLYSVSPEIGTINVTMGISYASTPFATLMSSIISMHLRARKSQKTYYYADVIDVLSHHYIAMIAPEASAKIIDDITKQHRYTINADEITTQYPDLDFLFSIIDDETNIDHVSKYIDRLVTTLQHRLSKAMNTVDGREYYELNILDAYSEAIADLCRLIKDNGIKLKEHTFLQMIERTMEQSTITFAGQPLKGLQLMSVMDTRSLDFDNLIMLSMNERVFPRRNFNPSMIPTNLRAAYNMPTQEHEESSYAYQFFRLISRAKHVRLLYDSRVGGNASGEMSRYLSQLLYLYPEIKVKRRTVDFKAESSESQPIVVHKTPEVMAQVNRLLAGGDLSLSASAIKAYLSCPLKFYLQYVKSLRPDNNDEMEYIDAASYGSVIHETVRKLYKDFALDVNGRPVAMNEYLIDRMAKDNLEARALDKLNEIYYKGRFDDHSQMPGEGKLISKLIAQYIKHMLEAEKALLPFTFVAAEFGEHKRNVWRINDKYTINFKMSVDRIDSYPDPDDATKQALRFIDYKTGSDELKASSLDALFNRTECQGMFQLMLYSHAYCDIFNNGLPIKIKPLIYKFQKIPTDGIEDLKFNKKAIKNFLDVDIDQPQTFRQLFEDVIDRIFDPSDKYPFCQTDDPEHCTYCPFATMCARYVDDKSWGK